VGAPPDIAFTDSVRDVQARHGSRAAAHFDRRGGFASEIPPELAGFIAAQRSFFLGTASASGRPYVQHRGGPPGFLHVLDERTLAFADYRGNRQYITLGNLAENSRAFIFLIDYRERTRVKLWGKARAVEDDAALLEALAPANYAAKPEQAIVFDVEAWDANCPQHIPRLYDEDEVAAIVAGYEARIAALTARSAAG
jgi:predicted pyridoxine 5'-phosphate oxidase superfamily flavin-nucleotide-binding protein